MNRQELAKNAIAKTLVYIEGELEEIKSSPNWSVRHHGDWSSPRNVMEDVARDAGVDLWNLDVAPAETDWEALVSAMSSALYRDYRESVEYDSEPGCNGNGNASDHVDFYLQSCLAGE